MVQPSRWIRTIAVLAIGILGLGVEARAQKWSAPVNLSNNQDFSTTPQVAVDASGNINVVWEDDTAVPNSNILFSRSTDGGKTFSAPQALSHTSGFSTAPRMVVDAQGVIYVVWEDDASGNLEIFFSKSLDGVTFSSPANLSNPQNLTGSQPDSSNPVVAVDAFGDVDVAWESDSITLGIFFTHSTDGGATFSAPVNLATNQTGSFIPQMALGSDGSVNVVWEDDTSSFVPTVSYAHSGDRGATFAAAKTLSSNTSPSAFGAQLAVDAAGNINIVWLDSTPGTSNIFYSRSMDQGATFSVPLNLSGAPAITGGTGQNEQIAVDNNGNIFVIWQDNAPPSGQDDTYLIRGSNGNFMPVQNVSNGLGQSSAPWLNVDGLGNVNVTWQLNIAGQNSVVAVQSSDGGATFAAVQTLSSKSDSFAAVQVAEDANGNLDAVWSDDTTGVAQIDFSQWLNPNPPTKNQPPVANAGADQTVHATGPNGASVTLDGSASSDPDGDALTFAWTDENGNPVGATAVITVTVPLGTHTFTLTVMDPAKLSSSATTHVTVNDQPPVARVGADQTVNATGPNGASVTLDGSASSDPDGDVLTYCWVDENGNRVGSSAKVQVTVPLGTHTYTLTVTDPAGLTSKASTHVTVSDQPPVARVGADQTVNATGLDGASVTLDGSASSDPDGGALTYCWVDENGNLVGSSATVQVTVPLGTHTYTLTVKDPAGLKSTASTHVTVVDTTPPVLQVSLSPTNLWPANHKLVQVTATISASDAVEPNPAVTLVSITSSDPSTSADDIQAVGGGPIAFGTDVRSFQLRAERTSNNPRVYTITYSATDVSGNMTAASAAVVVAQGSGVIAGPSGPTPTTPTLRVSVSPTNLWPANQQLVKVTASIDAHDRREAHAHVALVSITSSDPRTGASDVQGIRGGPVAFGTDVRSFLLRAEAQANSPRVYTITYSLKDESGSVSVASASVVVAHLLRKGSGEHGSPIRNGSNLRKPLGQVKTSDRE